MNQLPNIITSVRFFAAALIIWSCFFTGDRGTHAFLALFVAAGVSDMLDGHIARTYKWCTEFGAKFDSISDLFLYFATATFLWLNAPQEISTVRTLLMVGAATQAFHLGYALCKHNQFPAYHSTFSRVCAYLVFFGVAGFWLTRSSAAFPLLVMAWTLCSIEGIAMTSILKRPRSNLSGIQAAMRCNRITG